MKSNVLKASEAARSFMATLDLVGAFDVRADGSRSTGYVGKPGDGEDVQVTITIVPLAPPPGAKVLSPCPA